MSSQGSSKGLYHGSWSRVKVRCEGLSVRGQVHGKGPRSKVRGHEDEEEAFATTPLLFRRYGENNERNIRTNNEQRH